MTGRSGSSRAPSEAGKSEGNSGRSGGATGGGRPITGGAMGGAAVGPDAGVGAAGATPTMVLFIAAIVDGGGFAAIVGVEWTFCGAGGGTLIGAGSPAGLGAATAGACGVNPASPPPTPTIVCFNGFLGRC
jgi:hypothetical protein